MIIAMVIIIKKWNKIKQETKTRAKVKMVKKLCA